MSACDPSLIGESPEFLAVLNAAGVIAAADVTVLIQGESGTGKELMAEYLHRRSRRVKQPFVTLNCAALPEQLAESELFGHRRGSFTGAHADQPGRIAAAAGGTLFLDEIGELPLALQAKLLRFLESGEIQPLGSSRTEIVDCRVVAATNRDLMNLVAEGRFREDLYYRLNVVPLELPALRERQGDVDLLLSRLTRGIAERHGLPAPRYGRDALEAIRGYAWPGNVRELRNFCERMVVLLPGQRISVENLPVEFCRSQGSAAGIRLPESGLRLDEVERDLISQALERCGGNRSRAARMLGITRDTLLYRLRKYALS